MTNCKDFVCSLVLVLTVAECIGGKSLQIGDSDPAPGRSPGPPKPTEADVTNCDIFKGLLADEQQQQQQQLQDNERTINFTVSHHLFSTDILTNGLTYQVTVKIDQESSDFIDFAITSKSNDDTNLGFFKQHPENCPSNVVVGQLQNDYAATFNWTLDNVLRKSNVTFRLKFRTVGSDIVYQHFVSIAISTECRLWLKAIEHSISWKDIPLSSSASASASTSASLSSLTDCQVIFPGRSSGHGIVIEMLKLNIPCSKGYLHFSGTNADATNPPNAHRNHRQSRLCGKLEELPDSDRHIYFPSSHVSHINPIMHLHGSPIFQLAYRLVDYCYNVTFLTRNGTFELQPTADLECTFRILLPYGNRVALNLLFETKETKGEFTGSVVGNGREERCDGLYVQMLDQGELSWSHCNKPSDSEKKVEIVSRGNKVMLKVTAKGLSDALSMRLSYRAQQVDEIVGTCGFGWVALRQFCVSANEGAKLPWNQAEMECSRKGGHLVSIRSEHAQSIIDNLLLNSPGYKDNNAYWIGASDRNHEGDFHWTDALPFSYTNWFPGWSEHSDYNRQPNDDGLSDQDCVEVRRIYALPSSSANLANGYMWNDRDCSTPNYFICERLQNDEPLDDIWPPDCNRTVVLSRQQPRAAVSSPGFPRQYPDTANCDTEILAPPGYRLVLDFEELVIENESSCSYDYLEIIEANGNVNNNNNNGLINNRSSGALSRRFCGDWSAKLKLLRYVSKGSRVKLRFTSDYSHHYGGYKARVSMESALQCADDRLQLFNNSCYLFVSYPEVMWSTAQQICKGVKSHLASVISAEEERFITTNIRKMSEYRTSARYWLGARSDKEGKYSWTDGNTMSYMGWLPGYKEDEGSHCLGVQWTPSPTPMLPSGLYWKGQKCSSVGGYVCKRPSLVSGRGINFNKTVNGSEGKLVTPNFPGNYYNNLDFTVRIVGPERTRIVLQFDKIDLESQIECLYDYIELKSVAKNGKQFADGVKWCGSHESDLHRFHFVSDTNEVQLRFHSDYSITGGGFSLSWYSVDTSGCPVRTLTAKEGTLLSPNYPNFLLARLNCTFVIMAPPGRRVWIDFEDVDLGDSIEIDDETRLYLNVGNANSPIRPFLNPDLITEGSFVSSRETLKVHLSSKNRPTGKGFKATYKTLAAFEQERVIRLPNATSGVLLHLNYPEETPHNFDFTQHLIAPFGYIISLELFHLKLGDGICNIDKGTIDVFDNYADANGTSWHLCYDEEQEFEEDAIIPKAPIAITSFLNTLHVRQRHGLLGVPLNGTVRVIKDPNYIGKLLKYGAESVESCHPNPCLHNGKCVHKGNQKFCQCLKHYTGLFCALTLCDLEPCVFGTCELTETSFKCHCKTGYTGPTCEQKRKPCESNPCESRGTCIERGDSFSCMCHAWWEGARCERRMMHIPYKPLSERMLREPFWLGLMTVSVVMGVIGLFWCAKRHFPEKIEKLLAEEEDRNRGGVSSLRTASVREQLAASGAAAVTVTPSPGPGVPRSLFGRLGIRKPSILSLTSPHAGYSPATARTFSLDDLLKPPLRRTPSPKKRRNNSTPTKKSAAEKKQILQQLMAPNAKQSSGKVSLGELIQLTENRNSKDSCKKYSSDSEDQLLVAKETKFGNCNNNAAQMTLMDPKLEKKVTFARLLSKVSAEMSSSSEMELGIMQANRLSCALARPNSTPPSPSANIRSPNSTSSNQGSDSFTSSELAIPSALSCSISDLAASRRKFHHGRQKPSSADSILAMFRNFSSSSASANLPSSLKVSPSTTPTAASTPQDDAAGDDDSSTSSLYTPASLSIATPDSPGMQPQTTIELSVMDTLSAYKSSTSGSNFLHPPTIHLELPSTINKCLSPIREMPTPLPSPLPSPMMRRNATMNAAKAEPRQEKSAFEFSDEDNDQISDIPIDPQAEDGLILEEAAALQGAANKTKTRKRPPPLGQAALMSIPSINITDTATPEMHEMPPTLIIPMLTIETPSPTHHNAPRLILPGSPPPRSGGGEMFHFHAPNKPSNKQRKSKCLKDLDKPTSLDLPFSPPMITITCNMSEAESDVESISPNSKNAASSSGMSYLSPFSMVTKGEHTTSESNLSSSGYSSMASPGPSRCGSSNPLCPSEMEDPGASGSSGPPPGRRPSPLLKTNSNSSTENANGNEPRGRSDSETLSDDILLESNDEGIGTDHLEEKIEDGFVKSAKELQVFVADTERDFLQPPTIILPNETNPPNSCDKQLLVSPVSSRSESPLSDRSAGGLGRFSAQFYGRSKDFLPFTDSDGLYDFPSSDKVNITGTQTHRKTGRKREKKLVRQKSPSPTKTLGVSYHLELPYKAPSRKPSPKRRNRNQVVSSSSSSDSIASTKDATKSSSTPSPDTIRWTSSNLVWPDSMRRSPEASAEETADEAINPMLMNKQVVEPIKYPSKLSRLRAISHQIRFLRRLELSLKRRERTISPSESLDSGDGEDSPRATSPLLQSTKGPRPEIKKSSSIGLLQSNASSASAKSRRGIFRRSEYLLPEDESAWKRIVITGNGGHSD